jgi:hypothetical protein
MKIVSNIWQTPIKNLIAERKAKFNGRVKAYINPAFNTRDIIKVYLLYLDFENAADATAEPRVSPPKHNDPNVPNYKSFI